MRKKLRMTALSASLLVAASLALVAAPGIGAASTKVSRSEACGALTDDLVSGVTSIKDQLLVLPPDLSKVTGVVGTLTKSALSLVDLGCLPDPLSALPAVPVQRALPGLPLPGLPLPGLPLPGLPLPGLPVPGLPLPSLPVPGLPLPSLPVTPPGLPGAPAIAPCAAPAADLISSLFALVADLLKALGLSLPDVTGLLDQVTGLLNTVTELTTSQGGAPACLPVGVPKTDR